MSSSTFLSIPINHLYTTVHLFTCNPMAFLPVITERIRCATVKAPKLLLPVGCPCYAGDNTRFARKYTFCQSSHSFPLFTEYDSQHYHCSRSPHARIYENMQGSNESRVGKPMRCQRQKLKLLFYKHADHRIRYDVLASSLRYLCLSKPCRFVNFCRDFILSVQSVHHQQHCRTTLEEKLKSPVTSA